MNSTVPSMGNKFMAVAGSQSSQIQPMYFMAVAGSQSSQIQPRCFMVAMQPEKPIEICTFLIFSVHLYSYNIFTVQLYLIVANSYNCHFIVLLLCPSVFNCTFVLKAVVAAKVGKYNQGILWQLCSQKHL